MSYPPPHYYPHHGHHPPPPTGSYPPPPYSYPPPPGHPHSHYPGPSGQYPQPYYMAATMMVPVPVGHLPMPVPTAEPQTPGATTYVTNYIYHGGSQTPENSEQQSHEQQCQVVNTPGNYDWVPTTSTLASSLTGRAFSGCYEGWDGSPLWIIRAWHDGDLIPGKLAVRHNSASIPIDGKEVIVQNIEVLCAQTESLRWVPSSDGKVPPGAIEAGHKKSGERLYVGRGSYQLSLTPGKVDPANNAFYMSFSGEEVSLKMYDVLCRI